MNLSFSVAFFVSRLFAGIQFRVVLQGMVGQSLSGVSFLANDVIPE